MKIKIKDFANQINSMLPGWQYFVDKTSGEIISIDAQYMDYAKELDEKERHALPDAVQDEVRKGLKILERQSELIPFTDNRDLREYFMMSDFAFDNPDRRIHDGLQIALEEPGAAQRFENALRLFHEEDAWEDYKELAIEMFAIRWCEENGVIYENN